MALNTVFEDEFMDLQSGLISLCLEVPRQKVNKVYAYCSIEQYVRAFNAFFEINGEIITLGKLDVPDALVWELFRVGAADLDKIEEVCINHDRPIPREIKMYYDVDTGRFDAEYKYEPVCIGDIDVDDVFLEWVDEVKSNKGAE